MIYVGSALKQNEIIDTLEKLGYTYKGKTGIRMKFDVGTETDDVAVAKAKTAIKGTEYGKVLYFSVNSNPIA